MEEGEKTPPAPDRRLSGALLAIECLALLAVLVAAWLERSAIPLVPTADPDTWGYLNPALSWISGAGFQQTTGRDWLYPAFLTFFLQTTGSFAGIVVWQKILGMASGVFMAVTWRCWVSTLRLRRGLHFLVVLIGAVPILIQLMNPQSVVFEVSIRPEAVMSFFVYAQLACLMGYYKYRWQTPTPVASTVFGAAAMVLSYACFLLKPSWLFAFVITSAPVFVGIFGRRLSIKPRLLAPSLGIVIALLLLRLPPALFYIRDSDSVTLLPDALFAVHARLIDRMFTARLAALPDSDPEKTRLQALVAVLESEFRSAETDHPYDSLGFSPDYLMHSVPLTNAIRHYSGDDDRKFSAFCFASYRDAAFYDPMAFGGKITTQLRQFVFSKPDTFFRKRFEFTRCYPESLATWDPVIAPRYNANVQRMLTQYRENLTALTDSGLKLEGGGLFRKFCHALLPVVVPLKVLFLCLFLGALAWAPLRGLRLTGWMAASLFSAPLANAVMVCVVHALDIDRYRYTYGGFLLFALFAMAVFSVFVIARALRHAAGGLSKKA